MVAHILEERASQAAPANVQWIIAVAGRNSEISVEAATITQHRAADNETIHAVGGSAGDVILTTLRDADGEIIFQAPTLSIAYIRRFGAPNHVIPGRG